MQRKGKSAAASAAAEVLDEKEQEDVVAELREDVERQIRKARKYVYWLLLMVCVMMMTCFVWSAMHPLEMEHQAHFRGALPHWVFQVHYFFSSLCLLLTALTVQRGHRNTPRGVKIVVVVIAALSCALWLAVFARHGVTVLEQYWLPLANPAGVLFALYVERDAEYLRRDVERLEGLKYNHKGI